MLLNLVKNISKLKYLSSFRTNIILNTKTQRRVEPACFIE